MSPDIRFSEVLSLWLTVFVEGFFLLVGILLSVLAGLLFVLIGFYAFILSWSLFAPSLDHSSEVPTPDRILILILFIMAGGALRVAWVVCPRVGDWRGVACYVRRAVSHVPTSPSRS